jgi:hypothetical protein
MTLEDVGSGDGSRPHGGAGISVGAEHSERFMSGQPTLDEYPAFQHAFDFFNTELFSSELPPCMITLQRRRQSFGYYAPEAFVNSRNQLTDEIALNPACFPGRSLEENWAELVRHMCSHWVHKAGKSGRENYHNAAWADKMQEVGLMPTTTGSPGGSRTGQTVRHYIDANGKFLDSCNQLKKSGLHFPWVDRYPDHETLNEIGAPPRATDAASPETQDVMDFGDASLDVMTNSARHDTDDGDGVPLSIPPKVAAADSADDDDGDSPPVVFRPAETLREEMSELGTVFVDRPKGKIHTQKFTYECKKCKVKVWGKQGLSLLCITCDRPLKELDPGKKNNRRVAPLPATHTAANEGSASAGAA